MGGEDCNTHGLNGHCPHRGFFIVERLQILIPGVGRAFRIFLLVRFGIHSPSVAKHLFYFFYYKCIDWCIEQILLSHRFSVLYDILSITYYWISRNKNWLIYRGNLATMDASKSNLQVVYFALQKNSLDKTTILSRIRWPTIGFLLLTNKIEFIEWRIFGRIIWDRQTDRDIKRR